MSRFHRWFPLSWAGVLKFAVVFYTTIGGAIAGLHFLLTR